MSTYSFYEDGQGKIVDENGADAMEWEKEVDIYNLETLTNFSKYRETQVPELELNDELLYQKMEELAAKVSKSNSKKQYNIYIQMLKNVSSCTMLSSSF